MCKAKNGLTRSLSRLIRRGRSIKRLNRLLAYRGDWRTWYFAFSRDHDDPLEPWWMRWLTRRAFTHVLAFCQLDEERVLVQDWLRGKLDMHTWKHPQGGPYYVEWTAFDLAAQGYVIVRLTRFVSARNPGHDVSNCYSSCVMFCKRLLGIRGWIWTPQQLYRWLLVNDGHLYRQADFDRIRITVMGSFGGGNKGAAQANSQAKKQLAEQRRVNDVQIANLNAETAKLAKQRADAEAEATRLKDENERKKKLISARSGGRSSLIGTSEMGVSDTLG